MIYLQIRYPSAAVTTLPLNESRYLIGRSLDAKIHLHDISVSRTHASLLVAPGHIEIVDLQSSNGTYVNGKRIQRCFLQPGDQIKIGDIYLTLHVGNPEQGAEVDNSPEEVENLPKSSVLNAPSSDQYILSPAKSSQAQQERTVLLRLDSLRLVTLYQATAMIHSILEVDSLLQCVVDLIAEVMDADRVSLFLQEQAYEPSVVRHCPEVILPDYDHQLLNNIMLQGESVLRSQEQYAVMAVPLKNHVKVIGAILVENFSRYKSLMDDDLKLLQALAGQAGIALERARLHTSLKHYVEELENTRAELMQASKMAAMGQMAASMVHELKQPLTYILGMSELVLEDVAELPVAQDISEIIREGRRMVNLLNDLYSFSRKSMQEYEALDVHKPLSDALKLMQRQLDQDDIQVNLYFASPAPQVMADANQLEQVFLNLIGNARDALLAKTTPGKRRLVISTTIPVRGWLAVLIFDNGIGIASEKQADIFKAFMTTKKPGEGSGLGLAISQRIVESFAGQIDFVSKYQQGSLFRVALPTMEAPDPPSKLPSLTKEMLTGCLACQQSETTRRLPRQPFSHKDCS